jgi:hypothetical protein
MTSRTLVFMAVVALLLSLMGGAIAAPGQGGAKQRPVDVSIQVLEHEGDHIVLDCDWAISHYPPKVPEKVQFRLWENGVLKHDHTRSGIFAVGDLSYKIYTESNPEVTTVYTFSIRVLSKGRWTKWKDVSTDPVDPLPLP